jgi:hypothetical protein
MTYFQATGKDKTEFDREGFILVRGLFSSKEAKLLGATAREDAKTWEDATERADATGARTLLAVRDDLGDDVYSSIVRSRRIAESMRCLLGEEVYHYHHKLMLKEPKVGGAWEWHQDYGYWYNFGCLYPTMASCYIAIDRAVQANGCLQVLPKSHHLERIDHGKVGGQTGADPDRMPAILERFDLLYVEMEPGDGLFFHANLLHRSDQNTSDDPRWSLICCYNTRSNSPYEVKRHNGYNPLDVLDDGLVFAS